MTNLYKNKTDKKIYRLLHVATMKADSKEYAVYKEIEANADIVWAQPLDEFQWQFVELVETPMATFTEERGGVERVNALEELNYKLKTACIEGEVAEVKMLINAGAQVNAKDEKGYTPLYWTAYMGYKNIAKMLITAGAEVDVKYRYAYTSLHWAAYRGHKDIAEMLIKAGADINAKDEDGQTPLFWAVYNGHKDIVEMLINAGADVNAKDKDGDTPLFLAAFLGYTDTVNLLKQHGGKDE